MAEILDKTKEWSERFGHILRASAQTRFSHLYKGAVGGLEHVISVDNGGSYMEMWRDGGDQYYATTGAAIKPLPGLAKGARLDEALDRFFVLMTKVEKARDARPARDNGQRPARAQRKAIPKKIKRLAGVVAKHPASKPHSHAAGGQQKPLPHPQAGMSREEFVTRPRSSRFRHTDVQPVRKNIVEKVDPEIGPSMSVGHRKPSNLSPESSMRKMARLIVKDVGRLAKGNLAGERVGAPKPEVNPWQNEPGGGTGKGSNWPPKRPPVRKNVVALTGNQPGSGRVKPPKPSTKPAPKDYKSPQGFSGRRMGTPGAPGASRSGMIRQDAMGRKTSSRREKPDFGRPNGLGKGRKVDDLEGGRTKPGGGTTPVKPAMGGPGQPKSYGSTGQPQYRYGRKACVCDEVAKAVRMVTKHSTRTPHTHNTPPPAGRHPGGHAGWTGAQTRAHAGGAAASQQFQDRKPPKLPQRKTPGLEAR